MTQGTSYYVAGTTPGGKSARTVRIAHSGDGGAIAMGILSANHSFMGSAHLTAEAARDLARKLTEIADTIDQGEAAR